MKLRLFLALAPLVLLASGCSKDSSGSVSASSAGFTQSVNAIASSTPESTEPGSVDAFPADTSDTTEPAAL